MCEPRTCREGLRDNGYASCSHSRFGSRTGGTILPPSSNARFPSEKGNSIPEAEETAFRRCELSPYRTLSHMRQSFVRRRSRAHARVDPRPFARPQALSRSGSGDCVIQPGPGVGPIVFCGARRNAERFSGFFDGHSDEITQLHHFGFDCMSRGKLVERLIEGKKLIVVAGQGQVHFVNVHVLAPASMSAGALAAGTVDQNASHRLSRGGEEMSSVFKLWVLVCDQPQPGLVDQGRGLKCVASRFAGHFARRKPAQFLVNQWQ